MFKKILLTSAIIATSSTAFAITPYLGVGVGELTNTASLANSRALTASVFGGIGDVLNPMFYLGGELLINLGATSISTNNSPGATSVKSSYGYGLSIIPGLMLSDHTMAYLRAGLVETKFTGPSKTAMGGQAGLGIQTSLAQSWDLRGEYVYTAYQSAKPIKGNPRSDQYNLALVYKFD